MLILHSGVNIHWNREDDNGSDTISISFLISCAVGFLAFPLSYDFSFIRSISTAGLVYARTLNSREEDWPRWRTHVTRRGNKCGKDRNTPPLDTNRPNQARVAKGGLGFRRRKRPPILLLSFAILLPICTFERAFRLIVIPAGFYKNILLDPCLHRAYRLCMNAFAGKIYHAVPS